MSIRLVTKSIWSNPGNRGKRFKKTWDAFLWQLQKRAIKKPRILKLPNGLLFKAYPDCVVSSALIYADWPEYYELSFLRRKLGENQVIIDVGAYVGHISLLLADLVGSQNIFAFEPTPVSFQRLVENWQLNGWSTNGLFQMAVGGRAGNVFVGNSNGPLPTNVVGEAESRERVVGVQLVRLDDFRHLWRDRSIGLLKIDVEGYELEVFLGSRQILEKSRPCLIMFESLVGMLDRKIANILMDYDYVIFQLDSDGYPDFQDQSAQNLFAVPREYCRNLKA